MEEGHKEFKWGSGSARRRRVSSRVSQSGQRSQGARLEEEPWRVEDGGAQTVCRACMWKVDLAPKQGP